MWKRLFKQFYVDLFFLLIYHSQTDNSSKAINCVTEIILHHWFIMLKKLNKWFIILSHLQTALNNLTKYSSTNLSLNQILFEFKMCEALDLIHINKFNIIELIYSAISISTTHKLKFIQLIIVNQYKLIHIDAKNAIVFIVLHIKHYYNQNHTLQFFCIDDDINLQLHHDYILFNIQNKKFSQ